LSAVAAFKFLFVRLPSLGEDLDPLSPSPVATWAEKKFHVFFDLVVVEAIGLGNEAEADMITKGHVDELPFFSLRKFTAFVHKAELMKWVVYRMVIVPWNQRADLAQ
jgi:hypothetical protein